MHDRPARPPGAVKSAAAIAMEIMILLSIDLRIAQVRPRVEESVQHLARLTPAPAADSRSRIMITNTRCVRPLFATGGFGQPESFRGCNQYVSCNYE